MGRISARTGVSSYKLNNKWNKAEAEVKRLTGQISQGKNLTADLKWIKEMT